MKYIDIHTHIQITDSNVISVWNIDVEQLAQMPLNSPFSVGVHPWNSTADAQLNSLIGCAFPDNLVAIGECGFDKKSPFDFDTQQRIFIAQAILAEKLHKPLIIHCVGYFNELLACRRSREWTSAWIVHGFTGHPQLAVDLVKEGLYLSFGEALINGKGKAASALCACPVQNVFLETDDSELISIVEVYCKAAQLTGLSVEKWQMIITENCRKIGVSFV